MFNITIVDDYLNKRKIRARAPSDYMEEFAKSNAKIRETMQTHLIDDLEAVGVWSDDYGTFLRKRADAVEEEKRNDRNAEDQRNVELCCSTGIRFFALSTLEWRMRAAREVSTRLITAFGRYCCKTR